MTMLISDLKLGPKGGKWTNDTGAAVELNPPGIVVQPGESIEVQAETGNIRVITPLTDEQKAALKATSSTSAKDKPKDG
jgi:hypothetical protein